MNFKKQIVFSMLLVSTFAKASEVVTPVVEAAVQAPVVSRMAQAASFVKSPAVITVLGASAAAGTIVAFKNYNEGKAAAEQAAAEQAGAEKAAAEQAAAEQAGAEKAAAEKAAFDKTLKGRFSNAKASVVNGFNKAKDATVKAAVATKNATVKGYNATKEATVKGYNVTVDAVKAHPYMTAGVVTTVVVAAAGYAYYAYSADKEEQAS